MTLRPQTLGLIAATVLYAAGSAVAAPGAPALTAQYRLSTAEASGFIESGGVFYAFQAKSFTDFEGNRSGFLAVDRQDFSFGGLGVSGIQCSGAAFATAVSVSSGGAVTVTATLDPASADCFTTNYSGPPLTVRITGSFTGLERTSQSGSVTQQQSGSVFKFNYQEERFSESFTGTTGLYTGAFDGIALTGRSTNRTRVK